MMIHPARSSTEHAPRPATTRRLERVTYHAQQLALMANGLVFWHVVPRLIGPGPAPTTPAVIEAMRRRWRDLLARDLANVEQGLYPRELLFQVPLGTYARRLPAMVREIVRAAGRRQRNDYRDLPDDAALDRYPPYYRRTFHWQTDGYLSRRSARLYDGTVEMLFCGAADVMRRQVIPPVSRHCQGRDAAELKLLDIACGTGRTLRQLATAHPRVRYHGVDLSPYYIGEARRLLRDVPEISLVCENAEHLPYVDAYFDIVTSVYLFHELPRNARRQILDQAFRVLRPGGLLVLQDSAQPSESADLGYLLELFPHWLHEPFYRCYLEDDLAALAAERGFEVVSVEPHFAAKVVVARKPGEAQEPASRA